MLEKLMDASCAFFILDVFFAKKMILSDKQEVNKVFFSTHQQIKDLW